MKYVCLLFLLFGLLSCSLLTRSDNQDTAYMQAHFRTLFSQLALNPNDTLDCSTLRFGTSYTGDPAPVQIPDSLIQALISPDLLERAYFEPGSQHYALVRFPFIADSLEAFLIGEYSDDQSYRTQLFLFSLSQAAFVQTHTLNYVLGGGNFHSNRNAWLTDINGDGIYDIVYRRDEVDESAESIVYEERLHTETWHDGNFVDYPIDDASALESAFVVNESR